MRAVVLHEHGGIDKLTYEEHQDPAPGPDEVLVRVRACGVNHLDLLTREGRVASRVPLPHIMGSEVAGEVVGFGPHVQGLEIGTPLGGAPRAPRPGGWRSGPPGPSQRGSPAGAASIASGARRTSA